MAASCARQRPIGIGHNGGPPLVERRKREPKHSPEWGPGGIKTYFQWRRAHRRFKTAMPVAVRIRHDDKAEALGLTYAEYTLEIVERGRYLQAEDVAAVAAVKARRKARGRRGGT